MFLNYLKIFLRLFSRNRTFTAINLLGLATGLACFVLIRLYVVNETSYDRHYKNADNIYRLAMKGEMSGFSFESVRRTWEIGIRKAMGADIVKIVILLIREYPFWILIASILSLPASWYFASITHIDYWIFILSVILVVLISLGTTIIQTIRTARANPVDSLRYE